ncbi:MAG: hypothetical protein ACLUJG_09805 [Lawsonibacter sp.]
MTVTFTNGFDMDKYVSNFTASDFIVADAGQFQTGGDAYNGEMDVTEDACRRHRRPGRHHWTAAWSTARPARCWSSSPRSITAPVMEHDGTTRSSWTAWSTSRTGMRRACWPTGCSSTAWSSSPWTT